MASYDLLAMTLRILFYHFARHGDIRTQVKAKLLELETHHQLSQHISYQELAKLPYPSNWCHIDVFVVNDC
jgi:hypothetical protein